MYSVRVVVVSDTRHVAYYHRYAVRTEAVQLIQLWYTAIPWPYNPVSSISYNHDAWIPHGSSLMNKANSAVMSPFRNALSRNFSMLLLSPLPRRSFNNGLSKCIAVWRKETRPLPDHRPTTRADKEICEQPRVLELLDRRGGDRVLIYILCVCRGVVR